MSVALAKCLQILEIHHLKNNSLGDFFVFENATGSFPQHYFIQKIIFFQVFNFLEFYLLIVPQILFVLVVESNNMNECLGRNKTEKR